MKVRHLHRQEALKVYRANKAWEHYLVMQNKQYQWYYDKLNTMTEEEKAEFLDDSERSHMMDLSSDCWRNKLQKMIESGKYTRYKIKKMIAKTYRQDEFPQFFPKYFKDEEN